MRRKTRITILLGTILVVVGGGGGGVYLRQRVLDQRALESRARGMEAAKAGNYKDALHLIGSYLQRYGQDTDAEAMYEYAIARKNLPLPNRKELPQALAILRRAVELDPTRLDAQHELLRLYLEIGYGEETQSLARKLLEKNPDDVEALRADAVALTRLRKFEDARRQADRVAKLAPLDIENHLLILTLMEQTSASKEALEAYPSTQAGLSPDGPAYQIVQAFAFQLANKVEESIIWARRAGQNLQPDSKDVLQVNTFLERLSLLPESMALLARSAPVSPDPKVRQRYCQRLFEDGDMRGVMAQTDGKAYAEIDSSLIALRAMAFGREGKKDEVQKIVTELDSRSDDATADAWAPLLTAIWVDTNQTPQRIVEVCKSSIEQEPGNAFFYYFQGVAYNQLGDSEQAITAWQNAIKSSPTWIDPIMRTAGLLASVGRFDDAARMADEARRRAPNNINVIASLAEIYGANIDNLPDDKRKILLQLCQEVQSAIPLEPRTLPLVVDLLARQGAYGTAAQKIQAALDSQEKLPENTFLRLANLSEQHGLGVEQACLDKASAQGGMTPELALAQATTLQRDGNPEGGREMLAKAAASAGNDLQWQVVMAQYLDMVGSKESSLIWADIAKGNQDNPKILSMVLNSRRAWDDTAMIDGVINRLKELTGDDAAAWRTARARWLLLTEPQSLKAAAEAVELLKDTMRSSLPDASRLGVRATALERLSNTDGAIECLKQAVEINPDAAGLRLELVRLLYKRGKGDEAAPHIEKLTNARKLDPEILRGLARLYTSYSEMDLAVSTLLKLHAADDQEAPLDLLLAQLYRRAGKLDKAEIICRRFLQEKPDANVVAFAADLFASQGKTDEAQSALRTLDALKLLPGVRELTLAEYNRVHGTVEEAGRAYEEANQADSKNPLTWRKLMAFELRTGAVEKAIQRLPQAAAACPEDASFKALAGQVELIKRLQSRPMAIPFLLAGIETPEQSEEAVRVLEVLDKSPDNDPTQLAAELQKLVEQDPPFLALEIQLTRLYGSLNRHDDAAAVASRAMRDFPNEIEPAMLAAEAYQASEKWTDMLEAARELKRRTPGSPDGADLLIANAQTKLDHSSEARDTIKPYLDKVAEDPSKFSAVVADQASKLIASGSITEAADLLRPTLAASSEWRMTWLRLAALEISDDAIAVEWIESLVPLVPENSTDERIAVASAWNELAKRTKQSSYRDKARAVLEALASRPDATGKSILALAIFAEQTQDYTSAESNYRRALELDPTLTAARNNLAMRYVADNKNLPEALQLAQQAVKEAPQNANILDTLAQTQAALGDLDAAIQSLTKALELEPGNPQWSDRVEMYKQKKAGAAGAAPVAAAQ